MKADDEYRAEQKYDPYCHILKQITLQKFTIDLNADPGSAFNSVVNADL